MLRIKAGIKVDDFLCKYIALIERLTVFYENLRSFQINDQLEKLTCFFVSKAVCLGITK